MLLQRRCIEDYLTAVACHQAAGSSCFLRYTHTSMEAADVSGDVGEGVAETADGADNKGHVYDGCVWQKWNDLSPSIRGVFVVHVSQG